MKLIKANIEDAKRTYNRIRKTLEEFRDSGEACMEVTEYTHKHAKSCASSLTTSVRRFKMFNIQVITKKGRVFLINTLLTKELTAKKAGS